MAVTLASLILVQIYRIRMQTQYSRAKHDLKDLKDTGVIYSCESNELFKGQSKFNSILDRQFRQHET